ncbi:hypothetical protein LK07_00330 [Streptomyces pluripotens]|uniref:Uncharacterized protein n=1 Tax=Streptomyces pluripotens TaxID=1355015 RepID=A0A221NRY9_9ACTN|nr:hypothetical protein LK07_00330 [Streptomyces pluripotens]
MALTVDHPVAQTAAAYTGVLLGFSVVPAALTLLSLPALRAYGRHRATSPGTVPAPAALPDPDLEAESPR